MLTDINKYWKVVKLQSVKLHIVIVVISITLLSSIILLYKRGFGVVVKPTKNLQTPVKPEPIPTPKETLIPAPITKVLQNNYHIFQTFNNCGPASLSMALSYYGVNVSQKVLGDRLRPYQIANGDNDDKSVTLSEIAEYSKEYDLTPFHRPNGNIEIIKKLISYDLPIIVRTTTTQAEDIGHFRVIKGYNDETNVIIQDDSLQGKNLQYSYEEFNVLWKKFNYEYLVLVPNEKVKTVQTILGKNVNEEFAWQEALSNSITELNRNPEDVSARFNLSTAYYKLGDYKKSIEEFENVESMLPMRTLWYQIDPILSYYKVGNYEKVFSLTNKILNGGNRAFSELYIIRSKIYEAQGDSAQATTELQKAIYYNKYINLDKFTN